MDAQLRRALANIARDRRSGAAELALRAVNALQGWLRRHPRPTEPNLLAVACGLGRAQPSMAPLLRLANEVALAADADDPPAALARGAATLARIIRAGPDEIATRFLKTLRGNRSCILGTHSYSSTVLKAIRKARRRVSWVFCSESRPKYEGHRTAREVMRAGIGVGLVLDAALPMYLASAEALIVGADAVCESNFVNKVGTAAMVAWALQEHKKVWVLADTSKFVPRWLMPPGPRIFGPNHEVWTNRPRRVGVMNPYFEHTWFRRGIRLLSERGWMSPGRVRREVNRIRISPRLTGLSD